MADVLTPFEALQQAVDRAGGQSATARLLEISQGAVWKWLSSGKRLPAEHVLAVEAATGVSRHLLRPDIYPLPLPTEGDEPGEDCGPMRQILPLLETSLTEGDAELGLQSPSSARPQPPP